MKSRIKQAFLSVRGSLSADRVIADPDLNRKFLNECKRLGISDSRRRALLNMRKSGYLRGIQSERTSFSDQDQYQFASEIAIRHLERRNEVTLDDVICDPKLASEFDQLAATLAPGYPSLKYRWAALRLRKTRRLKPEPLGQALPIVDVCRYRANEIMIDEIPSEQGLYIFYDGQQCLYVGEAMSLRSRLKKHLDHSDNRGLARWLWQYGPQGLNLELQVLPSSTATRVRRAMELELIRSRKPIFNVAGT